jgi:hypothetical protein
MMSASASASMGHSVLCLALHLGLLVQGDVCHLLARQIAFAEVSTFFLRQQNTYLRSVLQEMQTVFGNDDNLLALITGAAVILDQGDVLETMKFANVVTQASVKRISP